MYDPVLNRPMFQAQNTATPMAAAPMGAKGTGITSMVTSPDPDTTMQQLKAFGSPVAPTMGYADGGPVQNFAEGGLSSIFSRFADSLKQGGGEVPDNAMVATDEDVANQQAATAERMRQNMVQNAKSDEQKRAELYEITRREEERLSGPDAYGSSEGIVSIPRSDAPSRQPPTPPRPPSVREFQNPYGATPPSDSEERRYIEERAMPKAPPMPPEGRPTEERSSISTELNKIREERKAQSAADRRENALMALMSAGFGMAAGKSRHALTNIAEGGQQGIATFANLEKSRREDDNRRYLADLHERELRMNEPYKQAMTEQAQAQAAYLKTRPASEQQRQQLRETTAMYNARKEAANEFIRRKKDDYTFGQQFNNPATGAAMEKEWLARRTRELMPEHLARVMNDANNGSQGNVSPTNAE